MSLVLIVEDSPTQAQQLQLILESHGLTTQIARNGRDALTLVKKGSFDLVLTDIVMPRLTGFELCRKIKSDPKLKHLPVIILTTLTDPMDMVQALECGADNYITKPYNEKYLIHRITSILQDLPSHTDQKFAMGVEIQFLGKKFNITSERKQILNLLISTFEEIVRANQELKNSQEELIKANARIEAYARQLEGETQQSEHRYRQLVEESLQGLMIIQRYRLEFCNPAFATMFGYAHPDELIGTDAVPLLHPADREAVLHHYNALMTGEDAPRLMKYRVIGKDESVKWLESICQVVTWGGKPAIQSTCIDVTNARQLEEQLLAAQRMEAVGRLAGGIAHDFNNMLAVMSSYGELAMDQLEENHPVRNDVQVMLDATVRAAALTRQLLAFSRRQLLELKSLDVNRIVTSMEKMLRRVIGEDIRLRTNLNPNIGFIRADESQIEQIIMNLAVNARDAMPTGGALTIETARTHLDEHYVKSHLDVEPGEYVMLAVTDTGMGMDEETQRRIFEPFFTTKPLGKGTGLGLSTVYGIVKQMAGLVYVYSEAGKGTCFKVYFPLVEETARQEPRATDRAQQLYGNETILLVEDDEHVREATRRILASGGYQVLVADNGAHAVELAKQQPSQIHLLISDVVMPSMSGREVLEQVIQYGVTRVLFMSGYTDDSVVNHGILGGDFPFLNKPFSKEALLKKTWDVLRSPPVLRPNSGPGPGT